MLSRIFHYIFEFLHLNKTQGLTLEDLDRMDVAYDDELTVFDLERMQLEDGEIVGTTAVIENQDLVPTGGKLPSGCEPKFDDDKAEIIKAAKCISFVLIEEVQTDGKSKKRYYGTAFWVSKNLLLTAGHNTRGVHGPITHIFITLPGCEQVYPWEVAQQDIPLIKCKVAGTIYKPNEKDAFANDIAILDAGSYLTDACVSLSSVIPEIKSSVDVIGYPGSIKHEWIEDHKGVKDFEQGQKEAERLLPRGRLTVTRGTLESTGLVLPCDVLPYNMSTCPGMSGSCVLYKGLVIGQCDKNTNSLPMAVSFRGEDVVKFLHRHNLVIH